MLQLCGGLVDIVRQLGSGSFGVVYLAQQRGSSEQTAVKCINLEAAAARLLTCGSSLTPSMEICVHQSLRHANIIRLLGCEIDIASVYIVTEVASGGNLLERVCTVGPLEQDEAKMMSTCILNAVQYISSLGIAHRDVKLENILVENALCVPPVAKLCDFSLARYCFELVGCRTRCGASAYTAPEVYAMPTSEYGFSTDMWSCGITIYAMLMAVFPFEEPARTHKDVDVILSEARATSLLCVDSVALLALCLAFSPSQRISARSALACPWLKKGNARGESREGRGASHESCSHSCAISSVIQS